MYLVVCGICEQLDQINSLSDNNNTPFSFDSLLLFLINNIETNTL